VTSARNAADVTDATARPGFNHNDFYHRFLFRRLPPRCDRALDVGCGEGLFARRLARHARSVDAVDRSPEMIARARRLSSGTPNIRFVEADLAACDLDDGCYDFIACIASIHHMPFAETAARLREALAPGGVLAIVGCYREATPADYLRDLVAIPANAVAAAAVRTKARRGRPTGHRNTAPIMDPEMTLPEIRREALRVLPAAAVRRRLYWRYTLVYERPPE
jgi:SAM-dependent methyltransferase